MLLVGQGTHAREAKKRKKKKKARLTNLEIYLVGCHVAKTKGSHALADTGPAQTINLPCHATIAAGPQRNSGPSSRLRKRTSELGFMEECSPEHAASPLPLLLNTDGTRLPSTMRKSLRSCAQPWFNRSTSSESPLRWIAAFSRPLVEERFRSNQGRNQQKATAMSIYRTTRKTIDFSGDAHPPCSCFGSWCPNFHAAKARPHVKIRRKVSRGRCGEAQQNAKGRIVSNICRHADVGHLLIRGRQGSLTCGSWHFFFVYF